MLRYVLIGVGIVAIVPIAWLAWWLLSPLWMDTEVSEEFPLAARAVIPENMTMGEVEEVMAAAAQIERTPVAESMPEMAAATAGRDEPQSRLTGQFQDADAFHKGSGSATVYDVGGGQLVLRLDEFRVTNGPDLRVLLADAPNPEGHSDLADAGYVELGKLKGNVGSQNYEIPDDFDLAKAQSVVIYCNPFRVVFSVASLEAPAT